LGTVLGFRVEKFSIRDKSIWFRVYDSFVVYGVGFRFHNSNA